MKLPEEQLANSTCYLESRPLVGMQEALFDWLIFQVLGWNVESTSKVSSDNTVKIGFGQVGPG